MASVASMAKVTVVGQLAELHHSCLEVVSEQLGVHYQGLTMAAVAARRRRLITPKIERKLRQLDTAASWTRHFTSVRATSFLAGLHEELFKHGGQELSDGGMGEMEEDRVKGKGEMEEDITECNSVEEAGTSCVKNGDKHGEQGYIMDTEMGVEGGVVADMMCEVPLCKPD